MKNLIGLKPIGGFTLVETVISLTVFMLVTLAMINVSLFAANATERITVRGELLETARIAIDVMSVHIKAAESIDIRTNARGLDRMILRFRDGSDREFRYNSRMAPGDARYQRLDFSGNELASYISGINVSLSGDILTLTVSTDNRIANSGITVEPIRLTTKIKLYERLRPNSVIPSR